MAELSTTLPEQLGPQRSVYFCLFLSQASGAWTQSASTTVSSSKGVPAPGILDLARSRALQDYCLLALSGGACLCICSLAVSEGGRLKLVSLLVHKARLTRALVHPLQKRCLFMPKVSLGGARTALCTACSCTALCCSSAARC